MQSPDPSSKKEN
jgi:hypothetical protein